ncbi:hypothetical protein L249_7027 [Ophiocordyceps polyrhachis-furcata BCC 54312]|uniref:Uncharacterized protein n=1 Tax=Ophiocordyceps polyrhachis-furcata BCC 54312 TaxID=1330021 RepID=A0A367LKL8_9HYPO|nr:hypothetical protein L249_7027 [Ophiocordyceps polyrhachis-furcata BCC 54312]
MSTQQQQQQQQQQHTRSHLHAKRSTMPDLVPLSLGSPIRRRARLRLIDDEDEDDDDDDNDDDNEEQEQEQEEDNCPPPRSADHHRYSYSSSASRSSIGSTLQSSNFSSRSSISSNGSSSSCFAHQVSSSARLAPPPSPIRLLPSSNAEWRSMLARIRTAFLAAEFDSCYTRCRNILDHARDLDTVSPAYLLYLSFYSAASLDALAGRQSPSRPKLRQLRAQYASALRHANRASISGPPTSPVRRQDERRDQVEDGQQETISWWPKSKKRVSFCELPRNDSPTLGAESWLLSPSSDSSYEQPLSPTSILKPSSPSASTSPSYVTPARDDPSSPPSSPLPPPPPPPPPLSSSSSSSPPRSGISDRYNSLLADIRSQIVSRIASLDAQLAVCAANAVFPSDSTARYEYLRSSGWRRPRFDARRYRALRENALADLQE